jgi:predicted nucleotidyltransferase
MANGPTAYPDLNALLEEFVESVQVILADNFCSAHLQGSFAVGDADEHSDVDFIVVSDHEITPEQRAALQEMHERLFALDTLWAQHLEGSYVPRESLRKLDAPRRTYLYLDNGSTELVEDDHCNTQVVRVTLREYGITLAGPDPRVLIDPVSQDDLRREVVVDLRGFGDWAKAATAMSRWKQPYIVLSLCRILHTLHSGSVASKTKAGEWALVALDHEWVPLIRQALDDRPDPWGRVHQLADPHDARRTVEFTNYSLEVAASRPGFNPS